jgi:hypothetical protein
MALEQWFPICGFLTGILVYILLELFVNNIQS